MKSLLHKVKLFKSPLNKTGEQSGMNAKMAQCRQTFQEQYNEKNNPYS